MARVFQHLLWRLEVLAYDIVRVLMMPFSLDQVSGFAGKLFRFIGPKTSKHHIARTNMKLAFPDASGAQIDQWLKESWNQMGRTFGEFPLLHQFNVSKPTPRIEVVGLEHFEKLKKSGKGAVLIAGHFANWELLAAGFLQAGLPVRVTYRPTNNPYFDKRILNQRAANGVTLMVPKSGPKGAKELITALRSGTSVALMNDQKFNAGLEIPFFGVPAMTAPGPTRLAMQTGVPLIPMSIARTSGANFRVTIHEEIKIANTGKRADDIKATVIKITEFIENQIRAHPTDWFWVHRRWPKELYKKQ